MIIFIPYLRKMNPFLMLSAAADRSHDRARKGQAESNFITNLSFDDE